jgi:hypothetical protein
VRASRSAHLVLRPFERTELDEMVGRHRADATTVDIDADGLLRLSGGNPLFAREVLACPSDVVPPVVAAVYGRFLEHVSSTSRGLLRAAAELGFTGEPRALAARAGVSEIDVIDALDEVAGGRLVHVDREDGSFHFVSELARRVLLASADTVT